MTPRPIEILAYHGWGFTASCWQAYQAAWVNPGVDVVGVDRAGTQRTWKSFDRGYFGTPQTVTFSPRALAGGRRIVIVHSYGLHLCPDAVLAQTDLLVVLNSFLDFHGSEPRLRQKSQRKLHRMVQAFDQDPVQTWTQFMIQTFAPDPVPQAYSLGSDLDSDSDLDLDLGSDLQSALLRSDLEALNQTTSSPDRLKRIPQIILVSSPDDRILSNPLTPAQLSGSAICEIHLPQGGHGAPFVHTELCLAGISEFLI